MADIKISDLSIGDWVRCLDESMQVYWIEGNSVGMGANNLILYSCNVAKVNPIPLTPEILDKNGFEIVDESADFQLYGSPECSIFFTKGTVRYRLETPQASVVCWNVHQLQHALRLAGVGKEIEV